MGPGVAVGLGSGCCPDTPKGATECKPRRKNKTDSARADNIFIFFDILLFLAIAYRIRDYIRKPARQQAKLRFALSLPSPKKKGK
jgi:hypothetical protein